MIEIADASLTRDRTIKRRMYALAAIPAYWIVNLIDRQVEAHTDPDPNAQPEPTYRRRETFSGDATVPVVIAGERVGSMQISALLPG